MTKVVLETLALTRISRYPFLQWLRDAHDVSILESESQNDERIFEVRLKTRKGPPKKAGVIPEYSLDDLLAHAQVLRKSHDYILARTLYSYILAHKDARNVSALFGCGICLFRLGDISSAFKHFKQGAELSSQPESLLWMAKCSVAQGKDLYAIELLNRIATRDSLGESDRFEFEKILGNCLLKTGRLDDAEGAFRHAISLSPSNDGIFVNLGMLELERSNVKAATNEFEKALQLNSKNVKALIGLGLAAIAQGEAARGALHFEAALDRDPQNSTALIQLLSVSGVEPAKVSYRAERLLELEPGNQQTRYHLAAWYFEHSNWKECEKHLLHVIQSDPTHSKAQSLLTEIRKKFQKLGGSV